MPEIVCSFPTEGEASSRAIRQRPPKCVRQSFPKPFATHRTSASCTTHPRSPFRAPLIYGESTPSLPCRSMPGEESHERPTKPRLAPRILRQSQGIEACPTDDIYSPPPQSTSHPNCRTSSRLSVGKGCIRGSGPSIRRCSRMEVNTRSGSSSKTSIGTSHHSPSRLVYSCANRNVAVCTPGSRLWAVQRRRSLPEPKDISTSAT